MAERKPAKKGTKGTAKSPPSTRRASRSTARASPGFTADERAAMLGRSGRVELAGGDRLPVRRPRRVVEEIAGGAAVGEHPRLAPELRHPEVGLPLAVVRDEGQVLAVRAVSAPRVNGRRRARLRLVSAAKKIQSWLVSRVTRPCGA